MKKVGIVFSFLVGVMVLTGCAKKDAKVVCTQTASGVDIKFNVDIKANVINNMDLRYDMDISKYSDFQINAIKKVDFCKNVKNSVPMFKKSFSNCKQDVQDKKLSVTADIDVNKLTDSSFSKNSSPEEVKSSLEKSGYKCTIEEK